MESISKLRMFVDHIRIQARAGNGGNGAVSFRREKYIPKGGPDGGDGGDGGSIILRVDPHLDNLTPFFFQPIYKAQSGVSGRGRKMYGRAGQDLVVSVPKGTLVYRAKLAPEEVDPNADATDEERNFGEFVLGGELPQSTVEEVDEAAEEETDADLDDDLDENEEIEDVDTDNRGGEMSQEQDYAAQMEEAPPAPHGLSEDEYELIADLTVEGEEFMLCRGGKGGRGNVHYKNSRNRAPREYEPGGEGESGTFYLELRKIADVGLVGYPNAGKSTLLGAISAAHPKVAAYPFTTLNPHIGVVTGDDYKTALVADIPGLIEGAHQNVGLGHEFLRHIMRCRVLFFVVDMAGSEGRHPAEDLATLREELSLYDPMLARKTWLVVANKMDLEESAEMLKQFQARFPGREVIPIAAQSGQGLAELRKRLFELLRPEVASTDE